MAKKKIEQAAPASEIIAEEQTMPEDYAILEENAIMSDETNSGEDAAHVSEEALNGEEFSMLPDWEKGEPVTESEDLGVSIEDGSSVGSLGEDIPVEDGTTCPENPAIGESGTWDKSNAEAVMLEETVPAELASMPFGVPLHIEEMGTVEENNPAVSSVDASGEDAPSTSVVVEKEPKPRATRKRTAEAVSKTASKAVTRPGRGKQPSILTIEAGKDVVTKEDENDIIWHEIHNAYRTRKILSGILGGIEKNEVGSVFAIIYYKGFRIVIPSKEMLLRELKEDQGYGTLADRIGKLMNGMMGAEVDFIIKGIDSKTHSVIASRRDAAMKKRQTFYMDTDASDCYKIYEGRIVQARVVAVAEKLIRVEVFGVETSILAKDLTWGWMGDARDKFSVGDEVLVCIQEVHRDSIKNIAIKADVKSVSDDGKDNLSECRIQSKYAGTVTDLIKGRVYVRLSIGVNAVAHSCQDNRMPGKKDLVSFAVTRIDEEKRLAIGIITRIIKQNL